MVLGNARVGVPAPGCLGAVLLQYAALRRGVRGSLQRRAGLAIRRSIIAGRPADLDHHLGDLPLYGLQRRGEHLLGADAAGVDVVVLDLDDGLFEDLEVRQVVVLVLLWIDGGLRLARLQRTAVAGEGEERCDDGGGSKEGETCGLSHGRRLFLQAGFTRGYPARPRPTRNAHLSIV